MVWGCDRGAEVNHPSEKCSACRHHLCSKAEGANEGEQLSFGAGGSSRPPQERAVDVPQLVWREAGLKRAGVQQDAQILQAGCGSLKLVLCQWNTQSRAEGSEAAEVTRALVRVWSTSDKEIIQVVVDWADSLLDCHPLNGISETVENEGG